MERVPVDKMELYESYMIIYHKVNLFCMLLGLLWTVIVVLVRNTGLMPLGAIMFGIPTLLAYSRFKQTRNIASLFLFLLIILPSLGALSLILLKIFFRNWRFDIIMINSYVMLILIIVILCAWLSIKYLKEYFNPKFADERLSVITKKSEGIALRIFLFLVTFTLVIFSLTKIKVDYMELMYFALFIVFAIHSALFLFFYKKI